MELFKIAKCLIKIKNKLKNHNRRMLATNILTVPIKEGFVISKGKTIFGLHKHTSHDMISRSRLVCFTHENSAQKCAKWIMEYSKIFNNLPPRVIDDNLPSIDTGRLPPKVIDNQSFQINLHVNKVDIEFMYNHCKYNDIALWLCDDFKSSIEDIKNGKISYDLSSVELIDPLTSIDAQVGRLEECYKK